MHRPQFFRAARYYPEEPLKNCTIYQAGRPEKLHGFNAGLTSARKGWPSNVSMEIINVDQVENGIVVNFKDGVCAFFDAAFLYTQKDKRIKAEFGDPPSTSSAPGW